VVETFIATLKLSSQPSYVFVIVTYAGSIGTILTCLTQLLSRKGIPVSHVDCVSVSVRLARSRCNKINRYGSMRGVLIVWLACTVVPFPPSNMEKKPVRTGAMSIPNASSQNKPLHKLLRRGLFLEIGCHLKATYALIMAYGTPKLDDFSFAVHAQVFKA